MAEKKTTKAKKATKKASGRKATKKKVPAKKVKHEEDEIGTSYYDKVPLAVDPARWCPTGIHTLDIALGRGLAYGKLLQIFGRSQSRKSTIAVECCGGWFRNAINPVVCWLDPEGSFLDHVAEVAWPDPDEPEYELPGIQGPHPRFRGKNAYKQIVKSPGLIYFDQEDKIDSIEDCFELIKRVTEACRKGGMRPLFVIDSTSRLTSRMEQTQGLQKEERMSHAKALRKAFRLLLGEVNRAHGTIIAVDHLKPTGVSGGSSTGFFSSWRIETELQQEIALEKGGDPVGFQTVIKTVKSRWAPRLEFPIVYLYDNDDIPPDRVGVNTVEDVFWALQHTGYLKAKGGGYYELEASPGPETAFRGRTAWPAFYRENIEPFPGFVDVAMASYHAFRWASRLVRHGKDPVERLTKYPEDVQKRVKKHFKDDLKTTVEEIAAAAREVHYSVKALDDQIMLALSGDKDAPQGPDVPID